MDFSTIFSPANLAALATLFALEVVLGIDNIIFIAILTGKLPKEQQSRARTVGISLAVITRILLLLSITWVMSLTEPLFTVFGEPITGRDIILLVGGLFLIYKSTNEIHDKLEGEDHTRSDGGGKATFNAVILQILLVDIIFSLDSVITAVGISGQIEIMVIAVVLAAVVMVIFAGQISGFVERHPTMKILALSFLILVGAMLVIEGSLPAEVAHDLHLKNYAYFAMAFSFFIELLNIRLRKVTEKPVHLRNRPELPEKKAAGA